MLTISFVHVINWWCQTSPLKKLSGSGIFGKVAEIAFGAIALLAPLPPMQFRPMGAAPMRAGSVHSNLKLADSWLGAVHKKHTQSSGQEGCPGPTFFWQGEGVIQMRTSALFVAKTNIKFFKIYSVSTWTGGRGIGASADIFWTRGGQFFMILCRHPLWTAPEQNNSKVKPMT